MLSFHFLLGALLVARGCSTKYTVVYDNHGGANLQQLTGVDYALGSRIPFTVVGGMATIDGEVRATLRSDVTLADGDSMEIAGSDIDRLSYGNGYEVSRVVGTENGLLYQIERPGREVDDDWGQCRAFLKRRLEETPTPACPETNVGPGFREKLRLRFVFDGGLGEDQGFSEKRRLIASAWCSSPVFESMANTASYVRKCFPNADVAAVGYDREAYMTDVYRMEDLDGFLSDLGFVASNLAPKRRNLAAAYDALGFTVDADADGGGVLGGDPANTWTVGLISDVPNCVKTRSAEAYRRELLRANPVVCAGEGTREQELGLSIQERAWQAAVTSVQGYYAAHRAIYSTWYTVWASARIGILRAAEIPENTYEEVLTDQDALVGQAFTGMVTFGNWLGSRCIPSLHFFADISKSTRGKGKRNKMRNQLAGILGNFFDLAGDGARLAGFLGRASMGNFESKLRNRVDIRSPKAIDGNEILRGFAKDSGFKAWTSSKTWIPLQKLMDRKAELEASGVLGSRGDGLAVVLLTDGQAFIREPKRALVKILNNFGISMKWKKINKKSAALAVHAEVTRRFRNAYPGAKIFAVSPGTMSLKFAANLDNYFAPKGMTMAASLEALAGDIKAFAAC